MERQQLKRFWKRVYSRNGSKLFPLKLDSFSEGAWFTAKPKTNKKSHNVKMAEKCSKRKQYKEKGIKFCS